VEQTLGILVIERMFKEGQHTDDWNVDGNKAEEADEILCRDGCASWKRVWHSVEGREDCSKDESEGFSAIERLESGLNEVSFLEFLCKADDVRR
jgi:hypothetical protein